MPNSRRSGAAEAPDRSPLILVSDSSSDTALSGQCKLRWAILAATALGLAAFGLFGLVQARYRTIDAPDAGDAKAAATRALSAVTNS